MGNEADQTDEEEDGNSGGSHVDKKLPPGSLVSVCDTGAAHAPSLAFSEKHLPSSLHLVTLWSGGAHANHLTPVPLHPHDCSAVYILYRCCKALHIFFFNCRLSLDSRSHDQLFLPHFAFFYALLSFDAFACFIFLLLVFSKTRILELFCQQ